VAHRPNDRLRTAREAAGLTQEQLAELANVEVNCLTESHGGMDADYISRLERGIHTWPNKHYRQALRVVLGRETDAELGFFSSRSRTTTVACSPQLADGGDDMERKAFLRVLAGSVAGLAFSDPLGDFVTRAATDDHRRVGQAEVDQIRHLARMFANQDHLVGSGLSSQAVVTQLSISANLLDGRFTHEAVRRHLFSATAELADVAGGMCFDAGAPAQAERCFRFAVGCATEAGDWAMRAKALSGLANLAVHQGRSDDALSYSEMALVRADRLTPLVRSVLHTRHARALGLNGAQREDDCIASVRQAEDQFVRTCGDEPDWITYYSPAHLERDLGRALLHLGVCGGSYAEAQQRLSTAVGRFPERPSRGKTLAVANLAHLTMVRDDPLHAAALGNEALSSIGLVRSDRVFEALRHVRMAGRKHRQLPEVRELNQHIDVFLRSSAV
jgi:transcriptional regulator with XRE-family HTH domain